MCHFTQSVLAVRFGMGNAGGNPARVEYLAANDRVMFSETPHYGVQGVWVSWPSTPYFPIAKLRLTGTQGYSAIDNMTLTLI